MKTALTLLIAAPLVAIAAHLTSLHAAVERACAMQMEKMDD